MRPLNHELSLFVVHTLLHTSAYTPQRFMKHHAGTRALNGGDRLCKKDTLVFRHFLCNVTNKHSKHLSQITKKSQPKHKITTVKSKKCSSVCKLQASCYVPWHHDTHHRDHDDSLQWLFRICYITQHQHWWLKYRAATACINQYRCAIIFLWFERALS